MGIFHGFNKGLWALGLAVFTVLPLTTWAHGGSSGTNVDSCRALLGSNSVHFTAYQPQHAGDTEYCGAIPEPGETVFVFDYGGDGARSFSVAFEVTREPEGDRIFLKAPETYPTGTANFKVNFTQPGEYLAHVTLVDADGTTVDHHFPLTIGLAHGNGRGWYFVVGAFLVAIGYLVYRTHPGFRNRIDQMTGSKAAPET